MSANAVAATYVQRLQNAMLIKAVPTCLYGGCIEQLYKLIRRKWPACKFILLEWR